MKKILIAAANEDVVKTVKRVCKSYESYFECDFF